MSRDDAKRRLGAYSDLDLHADARDLEITELKAQLEDARKALLERKREPRQIRFRYNASDVMWTVIIGAVIWAIVSKGVAW